MPANPPLTPAQQAALLRDQATLLEAQNRLRAAQQVAGQLDAATQKPVVTAPVIKPVPKSKWAIDNVRGPFNSRLAHRNAFFASMDRAQASYTLPYTATAAGAYAAGSFQVEIDRTFWICGVIGRAFATATQLNTATVGWVSVRDNSTSNYIMRDMAMAFMGPGPDDIWPLAYPIGAGGSFQVEYSIDPTVGLTDMYGQLTVQGFWDFTHV